MKTILTALVIFLGSVSFGQKDGVITIEMPDSSYRNILIGLSASKNYIDSQKVSDFIIVGSDTVWQKDSCWDDLVLRPNEITPDSSWYFIDSINLIIKDSGITKSRSFVYPLFHQFITKPVIEKEDVIIYSLQFVAGLADGMNQALVYHHALAGHPFWDYSTSWHRKYKNYPTDQRAAFPGAKTWSVMFTDGNHLTRGINRGASIVSVAIAMHEHDKWYEIVKEAIISAVINRLGFTIVYDHHFEN